jgi:hypothetical protein
MSESALGASILVLLVMHISSRELKPQSVLARLVIFLLPNLVKTKRRAIPQSKPV